MAFSPLPLACGSCPHVCKMAPKLPGISSTSRAVRREKVDGKGQMDLLEVFQNLIPLSPYHLGHTCPMALDVRLMRNVALGAKLCQLRLNWTPVDQKEGLGAPGEATAPGHGR